MMMSKSHIFTGLALAFSVSAAVVAPAKAEEIQISQLRGYEFQVPIEVYQDEWLQWRFENNIVIGRVRGKVGDIMSIEFLSPEAITINGKEIDSLNIEGTARAGDDVILRYQDEQWVLIDDELLAQLVDPALPAWVSRLELREAEVVERTAIEWSEDQPVVLPELPPSRAVAPAPAPVSAPEPVRGLW